MNADVIRVIKEYQIKHPQSRYNCAKCHLLLRDAYQTTCGCYLCEECRLSLFPPSIGVSGDQQPLKVDCPGRTEECDVLTRNKVRTDMAMRRDVARLTVPCPFSNGRCREVVMVLQLPQHFQVCAFALTKCSQCQMSMKRELLASHQAECPEVKVSCPHCQQMLVRRELLSVHLNEREPTCPKFEFHCKFCNDRNRKFNRETIQQHSLECPNWLAACPYHSMGCSHQASITDMKQHVEDHCSDHLLLMMRFHLRNREKMESLNNEASQIKKKMEGPTLEEVYIKVVEAIEKFLRKVNPPSSGRLAPVSAEVVSLIKKYEIKHPQSLNNCTKCHLLLRNTWQTSCGCYLCDECRLKLFTPSTGEDADRQLVDVPCPGRTEECGTLSKDRMYRDTAMRRDVLNLSLPCPFSNGRCQVVVTVTRLPEHFQQCTYVSRSLVTLEALKNALDFVRARQWPQGVFVWKIDDFERKRADYGVNVALESVSFYSPQIPSYRMKMRIYLNGKSEAPQHFSVFVFFLQGEYDEILDWPFTGSVQVKLISPSNMQQNHSQAFLSIPPSSPSSFQRPRSEEGSPVFGQAQFLPLNELHRYVVNNCIFLTCQVQMTER